MKITYKEIKPLVADATLVNNRVLCKFQDPVSKQVILSAADLPTNMIIQEKTNTTYAGLFKRALAKINIGKEIAKSPAEEHAIVKAFEKVSHLFEKNGERIYLKQ